jgi:hypothetical protein
LKTDEVRPVKGHHLLNIFLLCHVIEALNIPREKFVVLIHWENSSSSRISKNTNNWHPLRVQAFLRAFRKPQ